MIILNFKVSIFFYFLFIKSKFLKAFEWGLSSDPNDIHFYLFNSASNPNSSEELIYNNVTSVTSSAFVIGERSVIMIHGFWSNSSSHFPKYLKDAYLKSSSTVRRNYIVVDWGRLSTSPYPGSVALYPVVYVNVVTRSIPIVCKRIAKFVYFLDQNNFTNLEKIHIIGHSLGAHISGCAGNLITKENASKKKVSRITGLDPAGPGFDQGAPLQKSLKKDDALFVDAYHTAMGTRGDSSIDGHVDFYPNGGKIQPPCPNDNLPSDPFGKGSCSHQYVVDIYAQTVHKNITACKCSPSLEKTMLKQCLTECPDRVLAGEPCPFTIMKLKKFDNKIYWLNSATIKNSNRFMKRTRGQYYFETSSNALEQQEVDDINSL